MSLKILGSSHISGKFASKVYDTIIVEEPEIVAVELDLARARALFSKQKQKISFKTIRNFGLFGFFFALIGSKIQKYLGKKVGFEPGIDMKKAIIAAKKVNSKIILIDQPMSKTLQKLSKISFKEKVKLFFYLIWPFQKKAKMSFDLSSVPNEKTINKIIKDFKEKFPGIYSVLIKERNDFIAKNLIDLKRKFENLNIVAVLGAGHVSEVKKLIKNFEE